MKKKVFLSLLYGVLVLGIATGCGNNKNINQDNQSDANENINQDNQATTNENISENYTTIDSILLGKVKFKTHNPTYFWDSGEDFGSDIDTVFIVSENGVPVEGYYEIENLSGIIFEYDDRFFESHDSVKKRLNNWYGISNLQITDLENNTFSRHIKGETNKLYLEAYCMEYNDIYYVIELNIYKNDYTQQEIDNIISEYHTIINTFEVA